MTPHVPSEEPDPVYAPPPLARSGGSLRRAGTLVANAAKFSWAMLTARRPVRIAVGLVLLVVGIAGLFLPIIQGVATIIAALAVLRKDIPLAERVWQRWIIPLEQRFKPWWQRFRQRHRGSMQDS